MATAAVAATAGSIAVTAGPASAAGYCPDNVVCLFEHANWEGNAMIITKNEWDLGSFGWNDRMSSFSNHTGRGWCVYEHDSMQGSQILYMAPNTASWYVGDAANDKASSMQPC